MLKQSIIKNSAVLALFALITSLLLASTFLSTKEPINKAERRAAQRILLEIYPKSRHDNDLLTDVLPMPPTVAASLGVNSTSLIHVASYGNKVVGFIFPTTAPDGYSGDIRLMVGVNIDGSIAGVRVLAHKETPGLGDKVDLQKSDWILGFNNKSLVNPQRDLWKVKKDKGAFDQFTGATITPRAVVSRLLTALSFYREHQQALLKQANALVAKPTSGNEDSTGILP